MRPIIEQVLPNTVSQEFTDRSTEGVSVGA